RQHPVAVREGTGLTGQPRAAARLVGVSARSWEKERTMKDDKRAAAGQAPSTGHGSLPNRILGSLRDALNAASRDDRSGEISLAAGPPAADQVSARPAAEPAKAAAAPVPVRTPEASAAARPVGTADAGRKAEPPAREPKPLETGDPTTHALRA